MKLRFSIREPMVEGDTLEAKCERVARLGLEAIELAESSQPARLDEIRSALDATGLAVSMLCPTHGMALLDARRQVRDAAIATTKEQLTLAAELGAGGVIFHPTIELQLGNGQRIPDLSPLHTAEDLEHRLLHEILRAEIAPHAEQCGARLVIESVNRYEQWWTRTVGEAAEICIAVGSPHIVTMADLFHMHIEETDIAQAIRDHGSHIAYVHLADSNRELPGAGSMDYRAVLQALSDIDYQGYCTFALAPSDQVSPDAVRESMDLLNELAASVAS